MKHLKALLIAIALVILTFSLTACGGDNPNGTNSDDNGDIVSGDGSTGGTANGGNGTETPDNEDTAKILVAYFSCTNNTKDRAETLRSKLGADIYRIEPAVPYTTADLNYSNNNCRANREQNNPSARPEISGSVGNISQYDVIYLGYPIWWSQAPKIIYTFLESYDLDGVTIIPFCTSGSSGIGSSATNLHTSAPNAIWKAGRRIGSSADIDALVNMK